MTPRLAQLYACADSDGVRPSRKISGKSGIESLACGTPVVAFAKPGYADIVDHMINGYLA
jgi:glycosyltransferase involved in cell wall biosynthesis